MAEEDPPVLSEKATATANTTAVKRYSQMVREFFHKDNEEYEEEKPNDVEVDVEEYFQPVGFTQLFQ